MNFRERLEQSRERQGNNTEAIITAELEEGFSCEYFAIDNIKSLPACLDFRMPDGNRIAIPYSFVTEIYLDISEGILISTTSKKIKITGRDLSKLYDYLVAYRVRFVSANIGTDIEDDGLFIKEITIEDLM